MIAALGGGLAGPSFFASPKLMSSLPQLGIGPRQPRAGIFEEDAVLDRGYLGWLEATVGAMSEKLGIEPPARPTGHLSVEDHVWVGVLEQWRSHLDQRQQLELYVQHLEQKLLSLSTSYEVVDSVCNVPYPGRATDERYVAALEEAVATLERKASYRSPGTSSEEW